MDAPSGRSPSDVPRRPSSWGWAIVVTTFIVNLVLLPFRVLAARNAKAMQALHPQIDAVTARYKRKGLNMDPEYSREISEVYKQHQTGPLAGCISALVPLAVLIAFYSVLNGIANSTARTGCGSPTCLSLSNCRFAFFHCS